MERRYVVKSLVGLLAAPRAMAAPARKRAPNVYSPDLLAELNEGDEGDDGEATSLVLADIWPQEKIAHEADWWSAKSPPAPRWPTSLSTAPDYAHLAQYGVATRAFTLNTDTLKFLCDRNYFITNASDVVLFGLRGCEIPNDGEATAQARSVELQTSTPDHIHFRCVIGVWNRSADTCQFFKASTVPNVGEMYRYLKGVVYNNRGHAERFLCNMLLTGHHRFVPGTHKPGTDFPQRGAFRPSPSIPQPAVRALSRLSYDQSDADILFICTSTLGDDIHAAFPTPPPRRSKKMFSSAGCQVVSGYYDLRGNPSWTWSRFRLAAGLPEDVAMTPVQKEYDYILLTGMEAALAASESPGVIETYHQIRYGSRGPAVSDALARLGLAASSDARLERGLTGDLWNSLVQLQQRERSATEGILKLPI